MSWEMILKAPLSPREKAEVWEFFSLEQAESAKMIAESSKLDSLHDVANYLHSIMVIIISTLNPRVHPKLKSKTIITGLSRKRLKEVLGERADGLGTNVSTILYGHAFKPENEDRTHWIKIPSLKNLLDKMVKQGILKIDKALTEEEAWDKFEEYGKSAEFLNAPRYIKNDEVYLKDSHYQERFEDLLWDAIEMSETSYEGDINRYTVAENITIHEQPRMLGLIKHFLPELPTQGQIAGPLESGDSP